MEDAAHKKYDYITERREKIGIERVWKFNDLKWFDKKISFRKRKILDFGCAINGPIFKKNLRDGGEYFGFDISERVIGWLKENKFYFDFYSKKERGEFDVIVLSHVYEHMTEEQKEEFLKIAYKQLKKGGILILIYPFTGNLNITSYFLEKTHLIPPTTKGEAIFTEMFGFKTKCYLAGLDRWIPRFFLNLLLGYNPQKNVYLFCRKP